MTLVSPPRTRSLTRLPAPTREELGQVARFAERWVPEVERALMATLAPVAMAVPTLASATADAVGLGGRGGRRWRPLLTLAAAEACGGDPHQVLDLAAAVELTHTASLVLDDLPCMDDSPLRRNRPSTHVQVGTAGAILVAIGLLGRSAELVGRVPALGADWGRMVGLDGMAGGQAVDISASGALKGCGRRLHRRKTTALAGFALEAGALGTGATPALGRQLARFGQAVGWAYQVADDAVDTCEDTASGRSTRGTHAGHHMATLLRHGERVLATAPGLTVEGRGLLVAMGRRLLAAVGQEASRPC